MLPELAGGVRPLAERAAKGRAAYCSFDPFFGISGLRRVIGLQPRGRVGGATVESISAGASSSRRAMPEPLLTLLISASFGAAASLIFLAARTSIARRRIRRLAHKSGGPFAMQQMQHQVFARSRTLDLAAGITVMHRVLGGKGSRRKIPRRADIAYMARVIGPDRRARKALLNAYTNALKLNKLPDMEGSWDSWPTQNLQNPQTREDAPKLVFYRETSGLMAQYIEIPVRVPSGSDVEPLTDEEASTVSATSAQSLDHALAMLFIRLGPPPEPSAIDYAPASKGGGGIQQ